MGGGDIAKFGGKSKPFSKDNQPSNMAGRGRKKTKEIRKLMNAFGNTLAPGNLWEEEHVKQFLEANNLKGTYYEVLIAKLFAIALKKEDLKAFELIFKTLNDNQAKNLQGGGVTINFISPPSIEQEKTIVLENDSFTVVQPVVEPTD